MIFKKDLLARIDNNTEQIAWQGELIIELRERIKKLEKKLRSADAKVQPRDKSGKFAKKK